MKQPKKMPMMPMPKKMGDAKTAPVKPKVFKKKK